MIYCKRCGAANTPGDKYCKNCGDILADQQKEEQNNLTDNNEVSLGAAKKEEPLEINPIPGPERKPTPINKNQREFFKEANKKTNPITLIIIGAIIVVMLLVLWIASNFISTTQTYNLTVSGYLYEIPIKYNASVSNNNLTLSGDDYAPEEGIVIQLYGDDYDNLLTNFKQMKDENNMITNVEEKDFDDETWIVADYKTDEYKGVIGIKRISDTQSFWAQVLSKDYDRGLEILKEITPIINSAKWSGD